MAAQIVNQFGLNHKIVYTQELERAEYSANPSNRCYYCKDELFTILRSVAAEYGSATILDGLNADDLGDFRPGRKAGEEHHVRSPLLEAGLEQERNPGAFAARGASDRRSARLRMPFIPVSLWGSDY